MLKARWLKHLFDDAHHEEFHPLKMNDFIAPMDEEGRLSLSLWEQELTNSMLKLSRLLQEKEHQNKNVIYEIARYIGNHYDQDITLQDISAHFYLSREYISRWFKQEFQENITEYISRKRMDKAKVLLANRHMRIAEIAKIVGYQDEKYFSKVFKKLEGLSPNEYRKKLET